MERLTKDNEKLVEQIAMYEAQTRAQAEDTQEAKVSLSEVNRIMRDYGSRSWTFFCLIPLNIISNLIIMQRLKTTSELVQSLFSLTFTPAGL